MDQDGEYSIESVDHLGLIASLCNDCGLLEKINRRIHPMGSERVVNTGQSTIALILNGLGYTQRRLYLTEQFFENKPIDKLIEGNLLATDLTSDTLGKALDDIADYGETRLFSEVASEIALERGLLSGPYRIDTTSFATQGDYSTDEGEGVIRITQGYSKDHRPDLNQVVLSIVMQGPAELPMHMNALSGNSSDKINFRESIQQVELLRNSLDLNATSRWLADSALYTKDNLKALSNVEWITRVPETLLEAKAVLEKSDDDYEWFELDKGYRVTSLISNYVDVEQRWLLVSSEQSYKKEKITLIKKIEKEQHAATKKIWHLTCQEYSCEQDAIKQAKKELSQLKYHSADIKASPIMGYTSKGRPKQEEQQVVKHYKIKITLQKNEAAIEKTLRKKGRFILATNVLNDEKISNTELLDEYKKQQYVERGFRFIKNPEFLVKSIFLKSARRIQALLMIMTLTLFIYNLGQYLVRQALAEENENIPDQKKKPTQNPTLRWTFELMQGIGMISIVSPNGVKQRFFAQLTEVQRKIINLFGKSAQVMYELNAKNSTLGV